MYDKIIHIQIKTQIKYKMQDFDEMKMIFEDKPKNKNTTFIYHALDKNGYNTYGEIKQTEIEQFTKNHKIIKLV